MINDFYVEEGNAWNIHVDRSSVSGRTVCTPHTIFPDLCNNLHIATFPLPIYPKFSVNQRTNFVSFLPTYVPIFLLAAFLYPLRREIWWPSSLKSLLREKKSISYLLHVLLNPRTNAVYKIRLVTLYNEPTTAHNYFTKYHTATCFDTIMSCSDGL